MRVIRVGRTQPGPNGTTVSICKRHRWTDIGEISRICVNCGRVEERNKNV